VEEPRLVECECRREDDERRDSGHERHERHEPDEVLRRQETRERKESRDRRREGDCEPARIVAAACVRPHDDRDRRELQQRAQCTQRRRDRTADVVADCAARVVRDRDAVTGDVVRSDDDLRAEALDLQPARGLRPEALEQPLRREDEERQYACERSDGEGRST